MTTTIDQLADDVASLRTLVELIHKRGEDTSTLLYKWNCVGVPVAPVQSDVSMQKIEATTAQFREELGSIEASVQSMNDKPATEPEPMTAIQGEAMSFMLDPLEQAIESTARVLRDEHEHLAQISMTVSGDVPLSPVYKRMSAHLEALLSAQLKRVSLDE